MQSLQDKLIKWPSGDILEENVAAFEQRWGFPQVVGTVDGTHIPIMRPKKYHTDYFKRKQFYSIVMQAVVDSSYMFIDIYIGWPGSVHDACVLANSPLFHKAENDLLLPHSPRNIEGVDVPLLILGDPAYPLETWLMKPFTDNGRLSDEQKNFNYRLSRA